MSACKGHHCVCCGAGAIVAVNRKGDLWESVCRDCLAWCTDSLGVMLPQRDCKVICACPPRVILMRDNEEARMVRRRQGWSKQRNEARSAAESAFERRIAEWTKARRERDRLRSLALQHKASRIHGSLLVHRIAPAISARLALQTEAWLGGGGPGRATPALSYARKVCSFLGKEMGLPYAVLGRLMRLHHTTCIYGYEWIQAHLDDPRVSADVEAIRAAIAANAGKRVTRATARPLSKEAIA